LGDGPLLTEYHGEDSEMKIETDRLIIRSTQEVDFEPLAALWTDPDVTYYMGGPRNYEEILRILRDDAQLKPQPVFGQWPVIEKETGQLVGDCGILEKDIDGRNQYEIIYVLARAAWGKGFATEAASSLRDYAFNELGLKRITALIDPDNTKSEMVATKIGLRYEKDTVRPNGKKMRLFALNVGDCQQSCTKKWQRVDSNH
jgi:ribosomal-protein-alanine N-acetyltransferase